MKTRVKVTRPLKSVVFILTSISLLVTGLIPLLSSGRANAAAPGEVTARSIQMYNSTPGGTSTYVINFTTATAGQIEAVVVDYCSTDPILGDACSPIPTGFASGAAVGTVTGFSGESGGTWTPTSINSGRTFEYNNPGISAGTVSAGQAISITVTGNTNPSTTCSSVSACEFYARIFTFVSTANETTWATTGNGSATANVVDFGGIALSTASNITVNAKVQEMINFCVDTGGTCGSGTSTVNLGNAQGVLSSSTPYLDKTTNYSIQTNAASGAAINVEGPTLTYGGSTITNLTSPTTSTINTAQFGLCTYVLSGTTITPVTNYWGGSSGAYCSATASPSTPGASTTWYYGTAALTLAGDTIANVTAGSVATGDVVYLANIPSTQQAGLYTTTQIFIATGKY